MNIFVKKYFKKETKKYLTVEQLKEIKKAKYAWDLSDETLLELDNMALGFVNDIIDLF